MPTKARLLNDAIRAHIEKMRVKGRSRKTMESAEWVLTKSFNELQKAGMNTAPSRIGKAEVQYLLENVYGGSPYNRMWMLSFLKTFLEKQGSRVVDSLELEWPKCKRITVDWLDENEERLVWKALHDIADPLEGAVISLELGMGFRRIEAMRLNCSDIKGKTLKALGKGRNGGKPRTLKLNETVRGFLSQWLYERDKIVRDYCLAHPGEPIPDIFFIHSRNGKLVGYSETGIDKIVRRFRTRMESMYARTFDFSNHTMRRTFGRRLWEMKTPIETISEILGHESIDQTRDYLGLRLDDQDAPMKAQDDWVRSVVQSAHTTGTSSPNQQMKWAQGDLDSRPPGYQPGAPTRLSYGPVGFTEWRYPF